MSTEKEYMIYGMSFNFDEIKHIVDNPINNKRGYKKGLLEIEFEEDCLVDFFLKFT